jgi:hypothetical protein
MDLSKRLFKIGTWAYLCLFVLAVLFYKERIIFVDLAYHVFFIVKDNTFVNNRRFVATLTELLPLLARKAGLPLNAIVFLYSVSFILYYFTCYLICGRILKQYGFALLLLFFNILFVTDTFYWTQSELPQGAAILVILMAIMSNTKLEQGLKNNLLKLLLIFAGLVTAVCAHITLIIPCIFAFVFFLPDKNVYIERKVVYVSIAFFLLAYLIKRFVFLSEYEQNALRNTENIYSGHYFDLYANRRFLSLCISRFYWLPILFVSTIIFYCIKKRWAKLILFFFFSLGYPLFVNICYPGPEVAGFYIENLYLPLGIIISLPFIFDVLLKLKTRMAAAVVVLIILTGTLRIYFAHTPYTKRLNWEKSFLEKNAGPKKLIVSDKMVPNDFLMMTWGTPYEFWILSEITYGKTSSLIISDKPAALAGDANNTKAFVTWWGSFPYSELPPKYFHLPDSTSKYSLLLRAY